MFVSYSYFEHGVFFLALQIFLLFLVIAALRQIKDTKGVKLYVIRVRSDGSSGLSHPCPSCSAYIEEMGIKKVVYSTEDTFDTVAA